MERVRWIDEGNLVVDGTAHFVVAGADGLAAAEPVPEAVDPLFIFKLPAMVDAYLDLLRSHPDANVVELGVFEGGSVAFNTLAGRVRKLVAIDISTEVPPALRRFIDRHGLEARLRTYGGLDQSDRDALVEVVDREFGNEPLDLVIDDASHVYGATVASFEVLFPRLRPGGRYVIEDWAGHQREGTVAALTMQQPTAEWAGSLCQSLASTLEGGPAHLADRALSFWIAATSRPGTPMGATLLDWYDQEVAHSDEPCAEVLRRHLGPRRDAVSTGRSTSPLSGAHPILLRLMTQLVLGVAADDPAFGEITFSSEWTSVRRGPAALDPASFRLTDHVEDPFGVLGDLPGSG